MQVWGSKDENAIGVMQRWTLNHAKDSRGYKLTSLQCSQGFEKGFKMFWQCVYLKMLKV